MKCEQQVQHLEKACSEQLCTSLDALEALELNRLQVQREALRHAVTSKQHMNDRLLEVVKHSLSVTGSIHVGEDVKLFTRTILKAQGVDDL